MKNLSVTKLDLIAYLVRLSKQEIVNRALKSNKDYEAGNYTTQEQLELDSEKW